MNIVLQPKRAANPQAKHLEFQGLDASRILNREGWDS